MDYSRKLSKGRWELLGWSSTHEESFLHIKDIISDSRKMKEGWGFFALDGDRSKGLDYIPAVIKLKPAVIFIDAKYREHPHCKDWEAPILFSYYFKESYQKTVQWFYRNPCRRLSLVGITGTNGKTSVSMLLQDLCGLLQEKSVYIGTLGAQTPEQYIPLEHTTPDLITITRILSTGFREGARFAFLEVSSHALDQQRVSGLIFKIGVFTNLTREHLDYHDDMQSYFTSKKKLFMQIIKQYNEEPLFRRKGVGFVVGITDKYGRDLYRELTGRSFGPSVMSIGETKEASLRITKVEPDWLGYRFSFSTKEYTNSVTSKLLGHFNVYNISFCIAILYMLGFNFHDILFRVASLEPIKGRMELLHQYKSQNKYIVIDYAHTSDALREALLSLQELSPTRLILVFGCGGNRDQGKRLLMGEIASIYADYVILTNDNPRDEGPRWIIEDIEEGMGQKAHDVVLDRAEAIELAISYLRKDDVLLIAGKGHEEYQIIGDERIPFSDYKAVDDVIKEQFNF